MDTIAEGCCLGHAMAGSTNLELYKGRNYYWIISEPRENLDSGQPLVSIQKMMNKTKALINFNTQFLQNQNYFLFRFHVIWTLLFKQVLKTKDFESVLSGSVVITWIQLFTLFSNHPGASFTSNFFLWKRNQIFREETEIIISGI